jgi:hypothetical protein
MICSKWQLAYEDTIKYIECLGSCTVKEYLHIFLILTPWSMDLYSASEDDLESCFFDFQRNTETTDRFACIRDAGQIRIA